MQLPEEGILLRIFIGESDRYGRKPLYEAIVLKAKELDLAGATVLRGIMGFGATSRLHTAKTAAPVRRHAAGDRNRGQRALYRPPTALPGRMMEEGIVTMEKVRVLRYQARRE